jgi:hypothetical protein
MSLTSAGESSTIRILVKTDEPLLFGIPTEVLQLRSQAAEVRRDFRKGTKLLIISRLGGFTSFAITCGESMRQRLLSHPET